MPALIANGMAFAHHRADGQSHACLSWSWPSLTQALARDLAVSRPETAYLRFLGMALPVRTVGSATVTVCGISQQFAQRKRCFVLSPLCFISVGNVTIPICRTMLNCQAFAANVHCKIPTWREGKAMRAVSGRDTADTTSERA